MLIIIIVIIINSAIFNVGLFTRTRYTSRRATDRSVRSYLLDTTRSYTLVYVHPVRKVAGSSSTILLVQHRSGGGDMA